MISQEERYLATRNVTLIGVVGNVVLSIVKVIFGVLGHSQALIADGLHSISDLISDAVVMVAAKYSTQDADIEHPYGHARFETLAVVAVAALLFLVALGVLIDAGRRLFEPELLLLEPSIVTLVVAALSILIKEILFHYTIYVAKRVSSDMLRANAWHHRSDAISSVIVLIGIAGSMAGVIWLDAVAAIGVSLMIAYVAWSLGWNAVKDLVDTGLDEKQLAEIKNIIESVDGVQNLHQLRTRKMGSQALVDVHILVDPRISVSEGHQIGEIVRKHLKEKVEAIADVLVHIDPENDEKFRPNLDLPLRNEILARLRECWECLAIVDKIENVTLHYLSGELIVDVYLPLSVVANIKEAEALSKRFSALTLEEKHIHAINVFYH